MKIATNLTSFSSDAAEIIESRINEQNGGRCEFYVHYDGCKYIDNDIGLFEVHCTWLSFDVRRLPNISLHLHKTYGQMHLALL